MQRYDFIANQACFGGIKRCFLTEEHFFLLTKEQKDRFTRTTITVFSRRLHRLTLILSQIFFMSTDHTKSTDAYIAIARMCHPEC